MSTIDPPRAAWSASSSRDRGRRDPPRCGAQAATRASGKGTRPRATPGQQVDAREPGPLAVRGEQRVGLLGLDPAAREGGGELDQAEIALQASFVATEPLEADDADRPRAQAPLALQACGCGVGRLRLQALEIERAAEAHECTGAAGAETCLASCRGREAPELGAGRSGVEVAELGCGGADHRALDLPRPPRLDQLAGDGAEQRLRDGAGAHRAQARGAAAASRRAAHRPANRRRNSQWSSSSPSTNRTCSTPASLSRRDGDLSRRDAAPPRPARAGRRRGSSRERCRSRPRGKRRRRDGPRAAASTGPSGEGRHGSPRTSVEVRSAMLEPDRVAGLDEEPRAKAPAVPRPPPAWPRDDRPRRRRHRRAVRRAVRRTTSSRRSTRGRPGDGRRPDHARPLSPRRSRASPPSRPTAARCPSPTERSTSASRTRSSSTSAAAGGAAAVRARAVPRRGAGVRDDAEPLLPARGAFAAAVRPLAAAPRARPRSCARGASTTSSSRSGRASSRRSFLTASV